MYKESYKLMEKLYFAGSFQRANILYDEIIKIGYKPIFQEFNFENSNGCNIVVSLKGTSHFTVVISAHYDGLGAYDNISGVYMLLSLMQKFKNTLPFYSYKFLFFDKEEEGQIGSQLFVKDYDRLFGEGGLEQIIQHIAIDGCGIGESFVYINNLKEITFFFHEKKLTVPLLADFRSFQAYGVPSIHTFSLPENEAKKFVFKQKFPDTWLILHSEDDSLENIKLDDLKVFELALIRALNMLKSSKWSFLRKGIFIFNFQEN